MSKAKTEIACFKLVLKTVKIVRMAQSANSMIINNHLTKSDHPQLSVFSTAGNYASRSDVV